MQHQQIDKTNKNRMIVALIIIMAMTFCMFLTGCGGDAESASESGQVLQAENASSDMDKDKRQEGRKSSKKTDEKEDAGKEAATNKNESGEQRQATLIEENTEDKSAEGEQTEEDDNGETASQKKDTGSKKNKAQSGKSGSETCTVQIECKKLVGNKDLRQEYKNLVPSNGIVMSKTTVTVKSGDTVHDVLKRACNSKGIVLNVEQTQFGIYIAGIAGLEEKACGGESGWKYKVNGNYPGVSCSAFDANAGDTIVWTYVLKA